MKKLFTLLLAVALCLSIAACGGVDKQPAIDAFNNASDAYDKLVDEMNTNIEAYPPELIEVMTEMGDAMRENKAILESDQELTEELVAQMVSAFGEVQAWSEETFGSLDEIIAETNAGKMAVIEVFNETSTAFDALVDKLNANIDAQDQQTIDLMTEMAAVLTECKNLLESDTPIDDELAQQLISDLTNIKTWLADAEPVLLDTPAAPSAGGADKQAAIDAFNNTNGIFTAIATEVNNHPNDFAPEVIDALVTISEGLQQYKDILESDVQLSQEDLNALIADCQKFDAWALEHESDFFG